MTAQKLHVPDVGLGPGPFPSAAWLVGAIGSLTRLGFDVVATDADRVVLLVSFTGDLATDPIDETNPNKMGGYQGDQGQRDSDLTHATACPYYAFLRYPSLPGQGPPTVGVSFVLQGIE